MAKLSMSKAVAALLLALTALLCLYGSALSRPPDRAPAAPAKPHVPGEMLVRFKPGFRNAVEKAIRQRGAQVKKSFGGQLEGLLLVRHNNPDRTSEILATLLRRDDVLYAEPNYIIKPALTPDDPQFYRSWGLHNTGQRYRTAPRRSGTEDIDIDAPEAWDLTTGSNGTVVAVIDTGVNYSHPDLLSNIWANPGEIGGNSIDDDANGFVDDIRGWNFHADNNDPSDPDGHGTSVASIVGATGDNAAGTCGVCWDVSIMPVRVGLEGGAPVSEIVPAIQYAVSNGAHVINASWGTSSHSQSLLDAIKLARTSNVVFVAAAGNSSLNIDASPYYPASYALDNIITTAAIDANGNLASFSNYASTSVDIAAPGVDIYAAEGSFYGYFSGTSAAAPFVSGAAALLISASPGIPYAETCSRIITCAHRLDSLNGKCVSAGMLNVYNAINVGQPAVVVDSVSQDVLGTGDSTTITWTARMDGTYSVEVGGNGTTGSGTVIGSGTCQVNDQINSTVTEADLPDNQASSVYIIIEEALYAGFAVVTLRDDQTGPASSIDYPTPGCTLGTLNQVTGTAEDTGGADVATVRLAIFNDSSYYNGTDFSSPTSIYFDASGTGNWTFDSSSVPWSDATTYTLYVQAEDTVANVTDGQDPVAFNYVAGAPSIAIESISAYILGTSDTATVTWRPDTGGTYSIEVGGTGTPGTGSEIDNGACIADTPVGSVINESDLADNSANTVYVFVTAASITGSVSTTLYDDQTPPISNIIQPLNSQTYTELIAVLGRASDTCGASVALVEVQITDGVNYWDGASFTTTESWLPAEGTTDWSLSTSSVLWADFAYYTVRSRATDSVGNVESPSAGVTFYHNSGNTVIPRKKSSGCNLADSEGSFPYAVLLIIVLITFCVIRRCKNTKPRTSVRG